mmetsp:Transcript_110819/g.192064  ORF Transcript_110819/g.192064 Transcript_110819/m.192064 type:complete len:847 (+) Transcript_110819:115-2655(+)
MEDAMDDMMQQGKGKMKGKGKGKKGKGKSRRGPSPEGGGGVVQMIDNRVHNVGIHTIEIYYPQFWFRQTEMEEFDARPDRYGPGVIGKYTKGIGQVEARYPTDDEDPVSYAMTAVHKLIDRMKAKGINETARYHDEQRTLDWWDSVGRLDCGTESIIDRSKSIKTYCMDMFERYGPEHGNLGNIEGVDQYNACYGGQAAHLAVMSWVESDRWDGRYGIAVATDISDVPHAAAFCVGAACTATLLFPDAPLSHHGVRASCIMHRLDFCKPVGWHHMGPVTDGKYSVECYMSAIDMAHQSLRKKLNGKNILDLTDYNVFHTGGGFHIVKKAFDRLIRADRPDIKLAAKDEVTRLRLVPSTNLLKIVGPCHTVSSFLNISSVCMQEWERALGKVLLVYTYGSGMASSFYQLRFDDVPYYDPLPVWKMKFYEDAIWVYPSLWIHEQYVECWMKFDYFPHGRNDFNIDLATTLQEDVYYLMEIDNFGRRFYIRGGLKGKPHAKEYRVDADIAEGRHGREHYPPLAPANHVEHPDGLIKVLKIDGQKKKAEIDAQEALWRAIEYEMTSEGEEVEDYDEVGIYRDRYKTNKITTFVKTNDTPKVAITSDPDGFDHKYQIVGSWSSKAPRDMRDQGDDSWTFEMTLGDSRLESFHIIQDGDRQKRIYPYMAKAYKGMPVIGPHNGGEDKFWWIDGRERSYVREEDKGTPGDKYLITFRWKTLKEVTWEKIGQGAVVPSQYYLVGSWTGSDYVQMLPAPDKGDGWYASPEIKNSSRGLEFQILRNKDTSQKIYPMGESNISNTPYACVGGPDDDGDDSKWQIQDSNAGSVYKVYFYTGVDDTENWAMRVDWELVS